MHKTPFLSLTDPSSEKDFCCIRFFLRQISFSCLYFQKKITTALCDILGVPSTDITREREREYIISLPLDVSCDHKTTEPRHQVLHETGVSRHAFSFLFSVDDQLISRWQHKRKKERCGCDTIPPSQGFIDTQLPSEE
jgi:hypothetical protein